MDSVNVGQEVIIPGTAEEVVPWENDPNVRVRLADGNDIWVRASVLELPAGAEVRPTRDQQPELKTSSGGAAEVGPDVGKPGGGKK